MQRFTLASYRTIHQDAAFGVRQMVDIALKALSLTRGQRLRDGSQLRRLPRRRAGAGVRPAQTHADLILKAAEQRIALAEDRAAVTGAHEGALATLNSPP